MKFNKQTFFFKRLLSSHSRNFSNYKAALDYNLIPRPSRFSFVCGFMPGGEFQNASFYELAVGLRKRLGDIYVLPGLFDKPDIVVVFNTKDIKCVYRNEGRWPKRSSFHSIKYFREKIKGDFFKETIGLIVGQGQQWGKMRSAINPILMKPKNLSMYIKPLQEISDEFVMRIKEIRDPKTLEVPNNFDKELNRFAFESLSLIALNHKLGLISRTNTDHDAERFIQCTRLHLEFVYKLDIQPSIWKFIRTPTFYKNLKVQEDIFRITQKYINKTVEEVKEKQKKGEKNEQFNSILEKLLMIEEKLAVVAAMDMLFSGLDVTGVTIIAILLCLAKNPEKQQKLREEILKVMPIKETELNDNNMKHLPYLRAVIKESIRYYPSSPGALRSPIHNVVLSGYKVPKDLSVLMCFNCLLKDEDFFPQANQFIPERWLRNENNRKEKLDPFSYLPFSMGSRICVGKRLVEMEMEVVILKLLRNFEIEFNYDGSKPFKASLVNLPGIPMRFKFTDLK